MANDRDYRLLEVAAVDQDTLDARSMVPVQLSDCAHEWGYRGGPYRCEECSVDCDLFVLECGRCRMMVCRRCRFNRL
jgi:hypothetical protein